MNTTCTLKKKVYIAGKYTDPFISECMEIIKSKGHEITHDWVKKLGSLPCDAAINDIIGVKRCDILIAIMDDPDYAYRGTFTEIGAALALEKRIIIVNPNDRSYCKENCFYEHPIIEHVKTFKDAIDSIEK
jgi:hypothetical protein